MKRLAFLSLVLLVCAGAMAPQAMTTQAQQTSQPAQPQQQQAPAQPSAAPQQPANVPPPAKGGPPRVMELPVSSASQSTGSDQNALRLIPAPKEVERGEGAFEVGAVTRIIVNAKHAKEDRLAAQEIADEIAVDTGQKLRVTTAAVMPTTAGVIYLARAGDDSAVSARLKARNLAMAADFSDQGYVLAAERSRVLITARTGQGLFYGVQTLRQLILPTTAIASSGSSRITGAHSFAIPAVRIRDWPTMQWRGVHDDISRGPVPSLDYIKQQIRIEAEYKLNLHSLYIEHVFQYRDNPLIGPEEGSLNAAEVKEIVDYAKKYYVTILPEQQAFGHLHHVLKWDLYDELGETPHGHVLTPTNPKTYEFIKSLYAELVPLFPAPFFHIGSDETFELGTGRTKQLADQEGLGRVYLEHLQKVEQIMAPYHKRLMFWGDIAMKYPELLNILPKDMIAVAWVYDPLPNFDRYLEPFKNAGLATFVSPGANNWNQIWPNLDAGFVNIRNFVRDGQKYGSIGMLNTTWDDDGEALFGMTWPAIVLGGACSWQQGECNLQQFLDSYDWAFYRNPQDHTFRDVLADLTRTHSIIGQARLGSASDRAFWIDPFSEVGAQLHARAAPIARDVRLAAENALVRLYQNRAKAHAHADTLDYMDFAGLRLDLLGEEIEFANEISNFYWDAYQNQSDRARAGRDLREITGTNARLQDLRDATTRVEGKYRDLWLRENRPYWLQNVLVRYDVLADEYQQKINAMALLLGRQGGSLPAPQEIGFFHVEAQPAAQNQQPRQ